MTTQKQHNVLRQSLRRLNIKIDLLNEQDTIVSSFEGIATDGSVSISGSSSHRRSGNLTMVLDEKYNLIPNPSSKVWFNKRCSIQVGIDNYLDERIWFKIGRFAIDDVNLNFNSESKTIDLQLKDYMAFLDGTLGGEITTQIILGHNEATISEAIRAILTDIGNVSVDNMNFNNTSLLIPYDIEKPSGTTIYEIIKELLDLYEGYDFYYNLDGYLVIEEIRDKTNDPIVEYFDGDKKDFSIDSSVGIDFKNVKNSIHIWGEQLDNGKQPTWSYRNRFSRKSLIEMERIHTMINGDICYLSEQKTSFAWDGSNWLKLGFNVIPKFNIESIGERIKVVYESNISSDDLLKLHAEYELKNHSNFAETVSLSCVPLYNLDVNDKIYVKSDEGVEGSYLIKDITVPLDISSAMSITGIRLYN